jgi:hypothetical protein
MAGYLKYFSAAVMQKYPHHAEFLLKRLDENVKLISIHTTFAAKSANPIDRRLDFCAHFLALIKTLDEQHEDYPAIRRICLEVVTEYVRPKNWLERLWRSIPAKLVGTRFARYFLKNFNRRVSRKASADGFRANIVTDKNETFGFGYGVDIVECGVCKLFGKFGYDKYASILCEVDEITSELVGLQLIRTSTIALGAGKCDFRYKKISARK